MRALKLELQLDLFYPEVLALIDRRALHECGISAVTRQTLLEYHDNNKQAPARHAGLMTPKTGTIVMGVHFYEIMFMCIGSGIACVPYFIVVCDGPRPLGPIKNLSPVTGGG